MTEHEAAVVTCYTGYLIGDFAKAHEYAENVMRRPVHTHEFGDRAFVQELQERCRPDFIALPVDAEPVRHGEWILNPCTIYNDATWVCSVCGKEWVLIDGTPLDNQMNYCPKCGARMDGGTKANG